MRVIYSLFLILSSLAVFGQEGKFAMHDKNFNVSTINPLYFTYNSADELLEKKTIPNALEVRIKAKSSYNVYVNVQSRTAAEQNYINNNIYLKLASKTSKVATVSANEIKLSTQPQLLFIQPGKVNGMEEAIFLYDVILSPVTTFIKPGGYNFSITFTMTPQ